MAAREAIMSALFTRLSTAAGFVTKGRRLVDPENVTADQRPALFLVAHEDEYDRAALNLPPKRTLYAWALIYTDVGADPNAIPETQMNALLDAFDVAMAPDNAVTKRFTIGGLVEACLIDGKIERSAGDLTGKGVAAVPIRILLP